ncbi:MAG: UDP-N-acetylglucosamine 2-epimerase, partial [Actinobacteria bacterium]|nr:UDP-N-acetylglucosamine 2-epimerase [Actinomycetota bacterium]
MNPKPILMVLGIRPDVIRASVMLRELRSRLGNNFKLVWSGQHYSDNLKDVFFRELEILPPEIELNISGTSDAELVSSMITELSKILVREDPQAVVFLGD